jgi:small subunit ribosomal protein YMR-31
MAPPEIAADFNNFLKRAQSSAATSASSSSSGSKAASKQVYAEFWEAPSRYWAPYREMDQGEIEAVLVSTSALR